MRNQDQDSTSNKATAAIGSTDNTPKPDLKKRGFVKMPDCDASDWSLDEFRLMHYVSRVQFRNRGMPVELTDLDLRYGRKAEDGGDLDRGAGITHRDRVAKARASLVERGLLRVQRVSKGYLYDRGIPGIPEFGDHPGSGAVSVITPEPGQSQEVTPRVITPEAGQSDSPGTGAVRSPRNRGSHSAPSLLGKEVGKEEKKETKNHTYVSTPSSVSFSFENPDGKTQTPPEPEPAPETKVVADPVADQKSRPDWKKIAVAHLKYFGKRANPKAFRKRYEDACTEYTEAIVLDCFDQWAEGAKHWVKGNGIDHPLGKFFKDLPELAIDAIELGKCADQLTKVAPNKLDEWSKEITNLCAAIYEIWPRKQPKTGEAVGLEPAVLPSCLKSIFTNFSDVTAEDLLKAAKRYVNSKTPSRWATPENFFGSDFGGKDARWKSYVRKLRWDEQQEELKKQAAEEIAAMRAEQAKEAQAQPSLPKPQRLPEGMEIVRWPGTLPERIGNLASQNIPYFLERVRERIGRIVKAKSEGDQAQMTSLLDDFRAIGIEIAISEPKPKPARDYRHDLIGVFSYYMSRWHRNESFRGPTTEEMSLGVEFLKHLLQHKCKGDLRSALDLMKKRVAEFQPPAPKKQGKKRDKRREGEGLGGIFGVFETDERPPAEWMDIFAKTKNLDHWLKTKAAAA